MNELQHAPGPFAEALLTLAANALELNPGRYRPTTPVGDGGGCQAILCALRLLVRVQGVVRAMLGRDDGDGAAGEQLRPRGMEPRDQSRPMLENLLCAIHNMLWRNYFPMLERWAEGCMPASGVDHTHQGLSLIHI